jgi:hypothetical protein
LPKLTNPAGELVIIQRNETVEISADSKPTDDVGRFLPTQQLDPLIVHANYYSRDLEFQYDAIPSGPYLHVSKHPHSGDRCTVRIVLPDGSPTIVHRKHSITYLYPNERVIVDFGLFGRSRPKVHYRSGQGTFRSLHIRVDKAKAATRNFLVKLPAANAVKDNGRKVTDTAKGAFAVAGEAGKVYFETIGKLIDGIPGVKIMQGLGQKLPEMGRQEEIKQAGERATRKATEFIPTVR